MNFSVKRANGCIQHSYLEVSLTTQIIGWQNVSMLTNKLREWIEAGKPTRTPNEAIVLFSLVKTRPAESPETANGKSSLILGST